VGEGNFKGLLEVSFRLFESIYGPVLRSAFDFSKVFMGLDLSSAFDFSKVFMGLDLSSAFDFSKVLMGLDLSLAFDFSKVFRTHPNPKVKNSFSPSYYNKLPPSASATLLHNTLRTFAP